MPTFAKFLLFAALLAAAWPHDAGAQKKTVCTITVNSPHEKDTIRRNLPADKFQFVELVERGRSDWLASACRQGVRCDVLIVSGHYDGGNEFYSDRLDASEFLPVDELERVSCSDSCSGLFSQLKEVYLFGCNTLNGEARKSASAEIARSLVRSGHSKADADRLARLLGERHGESGRDRMQQIFADVPVLYGFSAVAPLGPAAAPILNRYFQSAGATEFGSGRASSRLLGQFSGHSMVVASGLTQADPRASHRRDVCQFADDRAAPAQKLEFIHALLDRDIAETRMFLDRIERFSSSLTGSERQKPDVSQQLDAIARDHPARDRYMEFARDADQPAVRSRMIEVAQRLGWLSPAERRAELMRMIDDLIARNAVGTAEVDLVCTLNKDHSLDSEVHRLQAAALRVDRVSHAAVLACLGNGQARRRVVQALTSPNDEEVQMAEVFLRHQPIADVDELRAVATGIARMKASQAQVRALETLARHRLSDPQALSALTQLFALAESAGVQGAIASVLIRSDYEAIDRSDVVQTLREHRLKGSTGEDIVGVLIRRLETH